MTQSSFEHTAGGERDPQIDPVVERFSRDPDELESLHALRAGAGEAWLRDGYAAPELFIDGNGEPVLVAPRQGETLETAGDRTYRFLYDNAIEDVVVPQGLQGFGMGTRGSGGYESIYNLNPADDPASWMAGEADLAPTEAPPALAALVAKFGDKLVIDVADMNHGGERSLVGIVDGEETVIARDVDVITQEVAQHRQQRDGRYGAATLDTSQLAQRKEADHAEAIALQEAAERAARAVKLGRFMTDKKKTRLVLDAYDRVVYGPNFEDHKNRRRE